MAKLRNFSPTRTWPYNGNKVFLGTNGVFVDLDLSVTGVARRYILGKRPDWVSFVGGVEYLM